MYDLGFGVQGLGFTGLAQDLGFRRHFRFGLGAGFQLADLRLNVLRALLRAWGLGFGV